MPPPYSIALAANLRETASARVSLDIRRAEGAMRLESWLWRQYWRCERTIAPGLRYSQAVYEDFLRRAVDQQSERQEQTHWLDLGCGNKLLPSWRSKSEQKISASGACLVGLDPDFRSLRLHRSISRRISGDAASLPFHNESFSLVTANMVVEHLEDPAAVFREISRTLKPGGTFLFHTPNLRGYSTQLGRLVPSSLTPWLARIVEGRRMEDVYPTHFRANHEATIKELARAAGLELERLHYIVTSAQFATILPLAVFELFWIRMLMSPRFENLRPNLLAVLRKPTL